MSEAKPIKTKTPNRKTKTSDIKKTIPKPSSAQKIHPERIEQQPSELTTEDESNWVLSLILEGQKKKSLPTETRLLTEPKGTTTTSKRGSQISQPSRKVTKQPSRKVTEEGVRKVTEPGLGKVTEQPSRKVSEQGLGKITDQGLRKVTEPAKQAPPPVVDSEWNCNHSEVIPVKPEPQANPTPRRSTQIKTPKKKPTKTEITEAKDEIDEWPLSSFLESKSVFTSDVMNGLKINGSIIAKVDEYFRNKHAGTLPKKSTYIRPESIEKVGTSYLYTRPEHRR